MYCNVTKGTCPLSHSCPLCHVPVPCVMSLSLVSCPCPVSHVCGKVNDFSFDVSALEILPTALEEGEAFPFVKNTGFHVVVIF